MQFVMKEVTKQRDARRAGCRNARVAAQLLPVSCNAGIHGYSDRDALSLRRDRQSLESV